ncbi:MAG: SDR family NAD(P)-dependent oxidoreductase [Spirochaetota bacterium]
MSGKFDYRDKIVLLTGASGGLGSSMARMLSDAGSYLVLSARSREALEELRASLSHPENAGIVTADLSLGEEVARLAREAESLHGRIDVVVNNAGLGYFATMEEADEERLRYLFEVNMFAPLALARELIPGMKARGSGRIVNVVSFAGRVPIVTSASYGGSKSALAIMMNTMRLELAGTGIDVINIYPGTAATAFEENALREPGRDRLCPRESCGEPRDDIARDVFEASKGAPGERWLDRSGRLMAVMSLIWPKRVERKLEPLKRRVVDANAGERPPGARRWRLWQIETSIACNLNCVMCPWDQVRAAAGSDGLMQGEVWDALRPRLGEVASIDFSGGGEALMNPNLPSWIAEAHDAGCETGFLSNGLLLTGERARSLINAGIDWIALSIDGATAEVYDAIRKGARFERLIGSLEALSSLKTGGPAAPHHQLRHDERQHSPARGHGPTGRAPLLRPDQFQAVRRHTRRIGKGFRPFRRRTKPGDTPLREADIESPRTGKAIEGGGRRLFVRSRGATGLRAGPALLGLRALRRPCRAVHQPRLRGSDDLARQGGRDAVGPLRRTSRRRPRLPVGNAGVRDVPEAV